MAEADFIPYCGSPPLPGELTWNTDPILFGVFAAAGVLYFRLLWRCDALSRRERLYFYSGLCIAALALMSPLCRLSVALFSARVSQHMVLTLIAAPLLVLGRADLLVRALLGQTFDYVSGRSRANLTLCIGGLCFTAAIWTWHLPTPYDATLENNMVYWTMHVTTMAAALVLWHGLLTLGSEAVGGALIIGFGTAMQMSLLGAILTFARRDLFSVHLATTWPWGLSPLEDQQLGGLIMWVPAGLVFTLYGLMAFGLWLHRFAVLRRPLA